MATSRRAKLAALGGVFGMLIACGAMTGCGDDSSPGPTSGSSGTSGAGGSTGTTGTTGTAGTTGASGAAGTTGTAGTTGATGATTDGGADATTDAGEHDATVDSSTPDTGTEDTGTKDTGTPDTSTVVDSGTPDTSTVVDSGTPDTSTVVVDSGVDTGTDSGEDAAVCETGWPTDGGANIVTNPDFESGFTGWTAAFGSSTVGTSTFAHCGLQSGELSDRTANYSNIAYALPAAGTYNFALWVAHDAQVDGGGASLQLSVQVAANCPESDGGTAQTFFNGAFPTIAANTWTFVSGSVTVTDGCTGGIFFVGQNGTQNLTSPFPDLFIDDVYIAPQ